MTNLDHLFREIAREQDQLLVSGQRCAQVRRQLAGVHSMQFPRRRSRVYVLAAACAVLSLSMALLWQLRAAPRLTAAIGTSNKAVAAGAWLDAPAAAALPLHFSDGTSVNVGPRSRMRLLELGDRGARLALESGRAIVHVTPGLNHEWELRAGPFMVKVVGTQFVLNWQPNEDQFELSLSEGQVELTGCGFGAGRKLVAGQVVRASCRDNSVKVAFLGLSEPSPDAARASPEAATLPSAASNAPTSSAASNAPTSSAASNAPTSSAASNAPTSSAASNTPTSGASASTTRVDWVGLAKQGKYKDALVVAERAGFAGECARAQPDELLLLADTARHAHEPTLAKRAYLMLRQRFAGSSQAGTAVFSLGLLEFDHWGAFAKAANWFRLYVQEHPAGPLTREARGRLMEALQLSGSSEARSLASAYLRDYPAGPHAELAQRIVQQ